MDRRGNNFIMQTRETGTITFTINLASGEAADLTGWTANFLVKNKETDLDSAALFTATQSEWDNNQFVVSVPQSFTSRPPDTFYYTVFLTQNTDLIYLQEGKFILEQGGSNA